MDKQPSTRLKRYYRILIVLCAALMIAGTVYAKNLCENSHPEITVVEREPVLPMTELSISEARPVDLNFNLPTDSKEIVNILLIGQDAVSETGARADTMILCTFNKQQDTITMTSFLRDLYVKIPGYQKNRLNAAFSFGGVKLLNETLYENFGIEIDGNIQVDFDRFEEIIDKLGGVTMELTAAEAAFINKRMEGAALTKGTHLLNGEQALLYARDRYDVDGDFSRTNRQRKLLHVLIDTCKSKKLTEMLSLMKDLLPLVTTDFSKADLASYTWMVIPMLGSAEIKMQAIPAEGAFSYQTIDGMSVIVPDFEKNKQVLKDSLT